jgi:molecular chaperone GrpE
MTADVMDAVLARFHVE